MYKRNIVVLFVHLALITRAQNPTSITLSIPKVVSNVKDGVVTVIISRRDSNSFIFPKHARLGNQADLKADLVFVLERKKNSTYSQYVCNIPMGEDMNWEKEPLEYENVRELQFVDSLKSLKCLRAGRYRLKLKYNVRDPDGSIQLPNFVLESKWVYFEVDRKMIYMAETWRKYNQ